MSPWTINRIYFYLYIPGTILINQIDDDDGDSDNDDNDNGHRDEDEDKNESEMSDSSPPSFLPSRFTAPPESVT